MRLESFIISLSLITIVLVGGVFIIGEQQVKYDQTVDNDLFENISAQLDAVVRNQTELGQSIVDRSTSDDNTENDLFKTGIDSVKNTWVFAGIAAQIITNLAKSLNIPAYIVGVIIGILAVSMAFALVYLVFRFKPND